MRFRIILLLLIAGCQRSQTPPEPVQYSVPADMEPYIKSFRDEALKRSSPVSTDNLIIAFGTAQSDGICGQCDLENGKTPRITINNNAACWQNASANERECLIFHELGHCLLKRLHRAEKFPNGAFVSLMNPDDIDVYATCHYPIGNDACDKRPRRTYYVDELFDASAPVPDWGK